MKAVISLATCLAFTATGQVFAGSAEPDAVPVTIVEPSVEMPEWQYSITPFLWATGLGGNATIGRLSVDVGSGGPGNGGLDQLESAAMLDFRARRGEWEFGANLVFGEFSGSTTGRLGADRSIGLDTQLIEIDAKYFFRPEAFGYFGARSYDVTTSLAVGPPIAAGASISESWIDPIIGAGFAVPLSDSWSVLGKADIGGFGIGSDSAWQAQAYIQYAPSETISILAGYRLLNFSYQPNNNSNLDLSIGGPVLGLRFNF